IRQTSERRQMSCVAVWLAPVLALLLSTCILPRALAAPVLTTIATFPGEDPAGLIIDAAGNLYGCVPNRFASSRIFEITQGSHTAVTLASVPHVDLDNLALDRAGNIFGTSDAGDLKSSSVFELAKGSHTVKTLARVRDVISVGIAVDKPGNVFWAVGSELTKGRVFKVVKGSHTLITLATFPTSLPMSISLDDTGNCFCTTAGGTDNLIIGRVVEMANGSHTAIVGSLQGTFPWCCHADAAGNLFGTTSSDKSDISTIFEIVKGSHAITPLATLPHVMSSYLALSSTGNIFATTMLISDFKVSSVVKLVSEGHQVTTLATFHEATPKNLILDTSGNLFGTTTYKNSTPGTVFEIVAPQTSTLAP
ncbi:MAG: hypothetical protein ACRYFS_18105, partial [Janthinobacterium lividum]